MAGATDTTEEAEQGGKRFDADTGSTITVVDDRSDDAASGRDEADGHRAPPATSGSTTTRRERAVGLVGATVLVIGAFLTTSLLVGTTSARDVETDRLEELHRDLPDDAEQVVDTVFGPSYTSGAGHVVTQLGCVDDLSAASLNSFFAERLGPSLGQDNQHVYPLGGDRYLWLFNDGFLDYTGQARNIVQTTYVYNFGLLQEGRCFELLHGGDQNEPRPFEEGKPGQTSNRFFWPLGGDIGADGRLYIFWAHIREGPKPRVIDGIKRFPGSTWIGAYDPDTLAPLEFRRAPDDGVMPVYGFAVESTDDHSYLFGNSYLTNLSREGGFENGPFSGTRMYLARVPRGEFLADPEYYDGEGWSPTPADAAPISERFYIENAMQPRLIDDRWVSVTNEDAFWSENVVIDVADDPWGPWTTVSEREVKGRYPDRQVTYYPSLLPWRDPSGDLMVMLALNHEDWSTAAESEGREYYRPIVYREPWPF